MGAISGTVAGTIGLIALAAGGTAAAVGVTGAEAKKTRTAEEIRASEKRAAVDRLKAIGKAPEAAKAKGQSEIERKRRIRALAGGKTILTTETALGEGAGTKTLLGS